MLCKNVSMSLSSNGVGKAKESERTEEDSVWFLQYEIYCKLHCFSSFASLHIRFYSSRDPTAQYFIYHNCGSLYSKQTSFKKRYYPKNFQFQFVGPFRSVLPEKKFNWTHSHIQVKHFLVCQHPSAKAIKLLSKLRFMFSIREGRSELYTKSC